jgi:hypothetical protein
MAITRKRDLAKFGYRLERKAEKFKNCVICWQCGRTYCLNMANPENNSS